MKESTKMVLVLTVIAMLSGAVLSLVYHLTYDRIQNNQARELYGSIFAVLPGAVDVKVIEAHGVSNVEDDRSTLSNKEDKDKKPLLLYEALAENGEPVGFAYVSEGAGFKGLIKVMIGIDHKTEKITGIKILEHSETPNIGTRVEDESFRNQFVGKTVSDPIAIGKDIDAVSGATVSSTAVTEAVRKDLAYALTAYKEARK